MWWKQNTEPSDAWRRTEKERGWLAGLVHFSASKLLASAGQAARTALWLALLLTLAGAKPVVGAADLPALSPEEALTRMEEKSAQRQTALQSYQGLRRYSATTPILHRKARSEERRVGKECRL